MLKASLGKSDAMATIAVSDIAVARKFYEGILGLEPANDDGEGTEMSAYKTGSTNTFVYQSEFAGTNKATAATWVVGKDLPKLLIDLKAKGVTFEHYDIPGLTLKGDIHVGEGMEVAWFKDPDGNILCLVNGD